MEAKHQYEYAVDLNANNAATNVVRMVGTEKRVLEIGAGPGSITRLLQGHGKCRVTAVELDEKAIEKLGPFCEKIYRCDLNDPAWTGQVTQDGKFEVVVAADVLEHLYKPWETLEALKAVMADDGCVVISLPHAGHNAVVACLVQEDFEYQDYGLLDKTHIRFFGIHNIQRLFDNAGMKIVDAAFVVRAPERTELARSWSRLPAEMKQALTCNRFGQVYQVVVKARLQSSAEPGLSLASLPVPDPASGLRPGAGALDRLLERIKLRILPYLSPRARARIGQLLVRLGIMR